ncbi:hypothetical protein NEOLEDRAFT_1072040 [Neolentinus lepideus HHB14362 ss-1]|uniref:Uncharacterized protein n=1 Tax=Neolentinus lepideus HHB14362 ss-1 TaxID=1314782 RepID=A0A165QB23_9AGAM|nr:hypothetical protein NEOLEDRAFT_1072040 [Neolentinus lepideus HHB14362 ss-1]
MTQPRPILKRSPAPASRHVHFPPSPVLTRTFAAHSPAAYDRSPIVVAPNACALPARGCPGKTYLPTKSVYPRPVPVSSLERHPHRTQPPGDTNNAAPHPHRHSRPRPLAMPPLIPDLSSESDESDASIAPLLSEFDWGTSRSLTSTALAFLPHPPTPTESPIRDRRKTRGGEGRKSRVDEGRKSKVDEGRYKAIRACRLKSCELEEKDEGCLAGF